jgi:hypothetical protein
MVRQLAHLDAEQPVNSGRLEKNREFIESAAHDEFNSSMRLKASYHSTVRWGSDAARTHVDFESITEDKRDHRRGTGENWMNYGRSAIESHFTLAIKTYFLLKPN